MGEHTFDEIIGLTQDIERERKCLPGAEVARTLGDIEAVIIIGHLAAGKDTSIRRLVEKYPKFHKVQSWTSRPERPGEADNYIHRGHTVESLTTILGEVRERLIPVQVAVHDGTGYVYGSSIDQYKPPYSVIDVLAKAVPDFRRLPFKKRTEIGIVASPESLWPRVETRISEAKNPEEAIADTVKRLGEAVFSLEWIHDQGPEFPIVVNDDDMLEATVDSIASIAKGKQDPDPENRKIVEQTRKFILDKLEG